MNKFDFKEKIKFAFPTVLLLSINVFLFAPAAVYERNTSEFSFGLLELLSLYIVPFITTLLLLVFFTLITSKSKIKFYVSILLAFALLFWLQGTFSSWDYGVFDGILIDWNDHKWHGWIDLIIWGSVLTAALIFSEKISKVSTFISVGLIILQSIVLVAASFSLGSTFWLKKHDIPLKFPESLTHYSANFNVVHVVLDHFQTDVFLEIIEENSLSKKFDGFTIYKENMTNVPHTIFSIPAMFSGEIYDGSVDFNQYYINSFANKGFHNVLFKSDYDVNFVTLLEVPGKNYTNYYTVPNMYGGDIKDERIQIASHLFEITLFRYFPQLLKQYIYNNNNWSISRFFSKPPAVKNLSHLDFFRDYMNNLKKGGKKPAYHFLHLYMPHPPYILDRHGKYHEGLDQRNRDNYKNQAKYTLKLFIDYLERLKKKGLYDNAFIILCSDHGAEFAPIINGIPSDYGVQRVPALLAIKLPQKKGSLKISNAPTMLSDIPATVMDVLGLDNQYNGTSVLLGGEVSSRKRDFIIAKFGEKAFKRYNLTGSIFRAESWNSKPDMILAPPSNASYKWGETIKFGAMGNAEKYKGKGWSQPANDHEMNHGFESSLFMEVEPPKTDIILSASFVPFIHKEKVPQQRIVILANDQKVGEWLIDKPGPQSNKIIIPSNYITSHRLVLKFQFRDAVSQRCMNLGPDSRIYALAIYEMQLSKRISIEKYRNILFAYPAKCEIIDAPNLKSSSKTVFFPGNALVSINDQKPKYSDYLEVGVSFKIKEFADNTSWLFHKFGPGWPVNVSFTFGFQPTNSHIILSENGKDVDGIWLPPDYFKMGISYDLLMVFNRGLLTLYIDNKKAVSKQLKFNKVFYSKTPIIIGENFNGNISNFYISNKPSHNLNIVH